MTGPQATWPCHQAASAIAAVARDLGFTVTRSAAGPKSRSTYVFADGLKIRVADHPPSPKARAVFMDVSPDGKREGSISPGRAIQNLRRIAQHTKENTCAQ